MSSVLSVLKGIAFALNVLNRGVYVVKGIQQAVDAGKSIHAHGPTTERVAQLVLGVTTAGSGAVSMGAGIAGGLSKTADVALLADTVQHVSDTAMIVSTAAHTIFLTRAERSERMVNTFAGILSVASHLTGDPLADAIRSSAMTLPLVREMALQARDLFVAGSSAPSTVAAAPTAVPTPVATAVTTPALVFIQGLVQDLERSAADAREQIYSLFEHDPIIGRNICPITQMPILDPVRDPTSVTATYPGHMYERTALVQALTVDPRGPQTRVPLRPDQVQEDPVTRAAIHASLVHLIPRIQAILHPPVAA